MDEAERLLGSGTPAAEEAGRARGAGGPGRRAGLAAGPRRRVRACGDAPRAAAPRRQPPTSLAPLPSVAFTWTFPWLATTRMGSVLGKMSQTLC